MSLRFYSTFCKVFFHFLMCIFGLCNSKKEKQSPKKGKHISRNKNNFYKFKQFFIKTFLIKCKPIWLL